MAETRHTQEHWSKSWFGIEPLCFKKAKSSQSQKWLCSQTGCTYLKCLIDFSSTISQSMRITTKFVQTKVQLQKFKTTSLFNAWSDSLRSQVNQEDSPCTCSSSWPRESTKVMDLTLVTTGSCSINEVQLSSHDLFQCKPTLGCWWTAWVSHHSLWRGASMTSQKPQSLLNVFKLSLTF